MADKDVILQEFSKTSNRLKSRGVDVSGSFFGYNEPHYNDNPGKVLWQPDERFVKVFPDEIAKAATNLSGTETIIMLLLMRHISYESGMLTKGGGYPLAQNDIVTLTGYNKKTVIYAMDKLVKKKMFARNKVGNLYQYFANPYIFFRGKYINKTLIDMFKTYLENSP